MSDSPTPPATGSAAADAGAVDDSDAVAEGTGETVGEAKWAALRELERRFPEIDKADVRFSVLSEGERGLLGVGYAPARVLAEAGEARRHSPRTTAE